MSEMLKAMARADEFNRKMAQREQEWAERYGIHEVSHLGTRGRCVHRLLGKPCRQDYSLADTSRCRPPGADHVSLWALKGTRKPLLYVMHPYAGGTLWKNIAALVDFCREYGLEANLDADSWYFPGRTLMVVIATPEGWRLLREPEGAAA